MWQKLCLGRGGSKEEGRRFARQPAGAHAFPYRGNCVLSDTAVPGQGGSLWLALRVQGTGEVVRRRGQGGKQRPNLAMCDPC